MSVTIPWIDSAVDRNVTERPLKMAARFFHAGGCKEETVSSVFHAIFFPSEAPKEPPAFLCFDGGVAVERLFIVLARYIALNGYTSRIKVFLDGYGWGPPIRRSE